MAGQILFPILLMALFGGYSLYTFYKRKKGAPEASKMFFERTGYRYADILNQPLEAHIGYGETLMKNARSGNYRLHMIRDFHGLPVHSIQEQKTEQTGIGGMGGTQITTSYAWMVPLPQPPRVLLQVAEKSLRGFGKGVKEAFSNSERCWEQRYQHEIRTGHPEFDARFNVYSDNPPAAAQALQTPGLVPLLLQCTEVDLTVYQDQIRFGDPSQKNMRAGMGGTFGAMSLASNPSKLMELTIPIHDHIAQLLATTFQATR